MVMAGRSVWLLTDLRPGSREPLAATGFGRAARSAGARLLVSGTPVAWQRAPVLGRAVHLAGLVGLAATLR